MKGYKLWDPKNKEFISSKHVALNEASMVKSIVSQQVEKMMTKSEVSQRVKVDATSHCPVGSVSSGIPSIMTPGGDRVADMHTEHVEKGGSDAARGTKGNLRRWVVKKHVSYVDEANMTRPVGFIAAKKRVG